MPAQRAGRNTLLSSLLARLPVIFVIALCCGLPLAWIATQIVLHPRALAAAVDWTDTFHLRLLGRTLVYNALVAILATLLALPAAAVLGRGRGVLATLLWFALPVALLMPSIAYAYGWSQTLRLAAEPIGHLVVQLPDGVQTWLDSIGLRLVSFRPNGSVDFAHRVVIDPTSPADVARCVWSLAAWLWPIPAGVIGLALRRLDVSLQQQALLDGALRRVTARQLAGPAIAAMACVMVLATQEFAVYEPTGISVVATEMRIVYETGAYSSPDNPITAPMGAGASQAIIDENPASLNARSGAAVATGLPLLVVIGLLTVIVLAGFRRFAEPEDVDVGPWPRALDASWASTLAAAGVVLLTLVVPTAAMILSIQAPVNPATVWRVFRPQIVGSITLAGLAGLVAVAVAFLAAIRGSGIVSLVLSLVTFLLGGQMLAIALIKLYNRPWLDWVYQGPPIVVMAYIGRFGWLALLAAAQTHARPWRTLRDQAGLDGASDARAALHVIWPLAWPTLGAGAVLVAILGLTEVPATVLISPLQPRPLVPLLMTWVHMLRYDDMLVGTLVLMGMVMALAVVVAVLVWLGMRLWRAEGRGQRAEVGSRSLACLLLPSALCLLPSGCDAVEEPDDIWLSDPGQVVYPRAITYSPIDDSFFVIDRNALIHHIDNAGKLLNEWRMPQWQTGKPVGVSIGPDGNVYIPDTHYQRVVVYSPKGEQLRTWGEQGTGPGQFIYPTDIAFDRQGRIFVSEYGDNDRIQVFDPGTGKFLYQFGRFGPGDGEFSRPQSMVIDPADDSVYIADACNHRICVFKTDGTWLRNMGGPGSELGQFRYPYGLAEDREGKLVVCEFGNNRLQRIDKATGRGLATWGAPGREPGQLAYPWAVAIDKRDRVVAVDAGNNRLQVFEW